MFSRSSSSRNARSTKGFAVKAAIATFYFEYAISGESFRRGLGSLVPRTLWMETTALLLRLGRRCATVGPGAVPAEGCRSTLCRMLASIGRILGLFAAMVAAILRLWYRAVLLAPEAKRRKRAKRDLRAARFASGASPPAASTRRRRARPRNEQPRHSTLREYESPAPPPPGTE